VRAAVIDGLLEVDLGPRVRAGFTTTRFNLALAAGVAALRAAWGTPLALADQVHGATVAWVTRPGPAATAGPSGLVELARVGAVRAGPDALAGAGPVGPGAGGLDGAGVSVYPACDALAAGVDGAGVSVYPACDALVAGVDGIGLVIRTADCVPVLLADPSAALVAAVHAGWRGLMAGVVNAALGALQSRGARHVRAAIGPAICADHYQVGQDLAAAAAQAGHSVSRGPDGTAHLDVAASVRAQLEAGGARIVADLRECTAESARLFSWRARRDTGRQAALIALT
jgi:YfiH family protein